MIDQKAWKWVGESQIGYDIWNNKYRYNNESFDEWLDRVSGGNAALRKLIESKKFLFGGRALTNRGTDRKGSMFNCYSSGFAPDDIEGLMQLNTNLALTYKAQGGQGLSLTHVRPKGTPIGNDFASDGIVPFMEIFNATTASISQGGARKGALMMSLDIRHKEAETFITIKTNEDKITKANLSLEIDDEFMEAVDKFYKTGEKATLHEKREYNGHVVEYDIIPIDIYKLMMETVHEWGEPGCIFTNKFRNYNLMQYDDEYQIETCNPCLHPDALIQTTEGLVKIKDMNKPMMVYCMDENKKLAIRKASPSFITKKNAKTINISINNGNVLKVTPDHLIYIKNKGWVEAQNLSVGDTPVALLRSRRGAQYAGVRLSTCPKSEQVMEHRLVYEAHYGKIEDGYDIHHKNGKTYDNHYLNLEKLSHSDHATLTRNECDNDHQVKCKINGRFISGEDSKHGAKKIENAPEDLRTKFESTPRIISIEQGTEIDVYDITVEEFHNFVADGIIVHNCGEQPLKKNSCCNLGSINLSEFVKHPYTNNAYFDMEEFSNAVMIAVEALDIIIDENLHRHALIEQAENSENYRNIGLGCMGYANMLFKLGITYGSEVAINFTDYLFKTMMDTALTASNNLAKEKGAFPKYKPSTISNSEIVQALGRSNIDTFGLRNCSLLSIAPTGSIATMLNGLAGGCEPEFALSYTRKTENLNGTYTIYSGAVKEYWEVNNIPEENRNLDSLPEYFVTSKDIDPYDRIKTQAAMQKWVDTAISSTINLPEETTVEEIEHIYLEAWKEGLKGITIYRAGCKRDGILVANKKQDNVEENVEVKAEYNVNNINSLPRGFILQADDSAIGKKRKLMTGCGSLHCTAFFDPATGNLLETYLSKGSTGGCNNFMIGLSRMISLAARGGVPIEAIIDQLNSCGSCPSYAVRSATKRDTSKGSCCPIAIGFALKDMHEEIMDELFSIETEEEVHDIEEHSPIEVEAEELNGEPCPICGAPIVHEGKCVSCKFCGWSAC